MRGPSRLFVIAAIAVLAIAACSGTSGSAAPGGSAAAGSTINVTSLWGGAEETAFQTVLTDFKAKTGVTANYVAQRTDYATVLRTSIQGGNPPDVAIMPGIGFLRSFAKDGSIKDFAALGIDEPRRGPPTTPRASWKSARLTASSTA